MRTPIIAAAAILATLPGVVRAETPCLTRSEFSNLAGYALPSVIGGANERCSSVLGSRAFLSTGGGALAERYASRQYTTWPAAKAAFLKLSFKTDGKANGLLQRLPDDTLQDMLNLMIEGLVSQEIRPEKCGTIDEFARLLSPLPPENTAELITLIVDLVGKPKKDGTGNSGIGKLAICQD